MAIILSLIVTLSSPLYAAPTPVFAINKPGASIEACYGRHLKRCIKFQYSNDYQIKYYLGEKFIEHKDVSKKLFSQYLTELDGFYNQEARATKSENWCKEPVSLVRRDDYVQITGQTWLCLDRLPGPERQRFADWLLKLRKLVL